MALTKSEIQKKYALTNPEKIKASNRNYYQKNKNKIDLYQIKYREAHPDKVSQWNNNREKQVVRHSRRSSTLAKYGLTIADYDKLLIEQNGVCKLCSGDERIKNHKLAVDHCHVTGKIRGLLCSNCNKGLGLLGDTLEALRKAIIYLEQNG